jgi:hypothetical protein
LRAAFDDLSNGQSAEALLTFVGHSANASALYHLAFRPLRDVLMSNADPSAVAAAELALERAEERRQLAYAALFRVEGELGPDAHGLDAARVFLLAIDRQRARGWQVLAWAANPGRDVTQPGWPDVRRIRDSTETHRERSLEAARAFLIS